MKILVVEESVSKAQGLRGLLEEMEHEVRMAAQGAEAWRILQAEPFPLVISDWAMAEQEGLSLCGRIRERRSGSYTHVILLADPGRRGDCVQALRAGADDLLVKPVDPGELAARLEIARRSLDVHARLERQSEQIRELAATDELTGLKNSREYLRDLEVGFSLAKRHSVALSLALLDVDRFRSYNHAFGHDAGDDVLREVAGVLKVQCRKQDTAARHGGEEFAVVLLGAGQEAASMVCERLRTAVAARPWPHRPVTVSFGVATLKPGDRDVSGLIEQAERALSCSKRRGRNCVTHHDGGLDLNFAPRSRHHRFQENPDLCRLSLAPSGS